MADAMAMATMADMAADVLVLPGVRSHLPRCYRQMAMPAVPCEAVSTCLRAPLAVPLATVDFQMTHVPMTN